MPKRESITIKFEIDTAGADQFRVANPEWTFKNDFEQALLEANPDAWERIMEYVQSIKII